jgi:hypothetical protein
MNRCSFSALFAFHDTVDASMVLCEVDGAGFVLRLYGFELDQDNTCEKDHALLCPH